MLESSEEPELKTPVVHRLSSVVQKHALTIHLILILALGLAIRIAYWQDARAYTAGGDEIDYVIPAQTLLRDGKYVDTFVSSDRMWTRVPLTQLVFAASFLMVPDQAATQAQGDDAALMQPRYDALNLAQ